jgi:amino-acid N-acetyltransferase
VEDDVDSIWRLLGVYAERRLLLPREKSDIRARLPVFTVAELDGRFAGCVAVRDFGAGLFEIRSLAVPEEFNGRWIGTSLVHGAVERLRATPPPRRVFALTLRPGLFVRAGFKVVDKSLFPQKIWSDCSQCPKKDCCDETAVLLELN